MVSLLRQTFPLGKTLANASLCRPATTRVAIQARTAASSVSSQPASTSFKHAGQNVKEELGDAVRAFQGGDPKSHDEDSILESVFGGKISEVPQGFMTLGTLGVLPYVGTGFVSVWTARAAHLTTGAEFTDNITILTSMEHLQITCGAMILGSLGFIHWGLEAAQFGGVQGYKRLLIGVAPVLAAWPTLYVGDLGIALSMQMATFFGMWIVDRSAGIWGWTPHWYTAYRFYLTSLLGATVMLTFIGTNYFAPDYKSKDLKAYKGEPAKAHLNALNSSETAQAKESAAEPGRGMTTTKFEGVHSKISTIPNEGTGEVAVRDLEKEKQEKEEEEKKAKEEEEEKKKEKNSEGEKKEEPNKEEPKKDDKKPADNDSKKSEERSKGEAVAEKGAEKKEKLKDGDKEKGEELEKSNDTGKGKNDGKDIPSKKDSDNGYKKIQGAIALAKKEAAFNNVQYDIQFHPFLLDPTLTTTPISKRTRYIQKFGSPARVDQMNASMAQRGKENGIAFSFGGDVSQTTDAHRLLSYAYEKKGMEGQLKLIELLFKGYFEEEKDPGSHAFLSQSAFEAGTFPTTADAEAFLKSNEFLAEVKQSFLKASRLGIQGVPFTVVENKYAISGAQDSESFAEIFQKVAKGVSPA